MSTHGETSTDRPAPAPTERLRKGRTLAERRQERREALLDAALELFGTKGYASTSVEEICRTAMVSTRNFYEEFDNREAVLVELADRITTAAMRAVVDADYDRTPGPGRMRREAEARVRPLVHSLLDDDRKARIAFIETLGVSPAQEARRREVHRAFGEYLGGVINADMEAGRITDRRQEVFALALVGAINEVLSDYVVRDDKPDKDSLVTSIVDIIELMASSLRREG